MRLEPCCPETRMSEEARSAMSIPEADRFICRHLCSKQMYVFGADAIDPRSHDSSTHQYWCNQTMQVVGPDGGFVHVEECTSERNCFESEDDEG